MNVIKLNSVIFLTILQILNVFIVKFVQISKYVLCEMRIDNVYIM